MFNYSVKIKFIMFSILPTNESLNDKNMYIEGFLTKPKTVFSTIAFVCSLMMILFCIVGAFGNTMSLIIFTRPSMRRFSINVLLAGLSAIDLSMVTLAIPVFAVNGLNDYLLDRKLYENLYTAVVFVLYPITMMAQTCSIYTFVLISIERFYAVVHPLRVKRLLTVRKARIAQLGIVIMAFLYNFIRIFEYTPTSDPQTGYYKRYLRSSKLYFNLYYTSLYLLFNFLIPFTVITTLNVQILRRLRRARVERERLSHAQQEQCRTTRMIIMVTVMFTICNCLPFLMNFWEAIDFRLFDEKEYIVQDSGEYEQPNFASDHDGGVNSKSSIAFLILDISNTLVVANAASPFVVCLIYCKRYRKLFWRYCCPWNNRHELVDMGQLAASSSMMTSSLVVRPYSSSVDNFSNLVINEFRPRSNCIRNGKNMRIHKSTDLDKCARQDLLRSRLYQRRNPVFARVLERSYSR